MTKKTVSKYRQRGFKCSVCKTIQLVYSDSPAPVACILAPCEGTPALKWDQTVEQTTTVTDN